MKKLKVAQFGLGPIGIGCLKLLATKSWAEVVGAIDIDPEKRGTELRKLTGGSVSRRIQVVASIDELDRKPDLVFHTTVSSLDAAYEQVAPILRRRINVISSCEELAFPQLRFPMLAEELNHICANAGVRLLGTGVNPGFVMDLLPVCLSGVSSNITSIRVERVVDACTRRGSLQKKIGSGLNPRLFGELLRRGQAGHAGLSESLALMVHGLGDKIGAFHQKADPVIAKRAIRTQYVQVQAGQTCGLHQRVETRTRSGVAISLDLKMYLKAADPHDQIKIGGRPDIDLVIHGGLAGDQATVAALVNCAPRLLRSAPGLRLMTDLSAA